MCQLLSSLQGAQRADPGSTAFSNSSQGALGSIPWEISPGPLLREPELWARTPCIPNLEHCLLHSIQGQKDLGFQSCSTHSCALQKTLNSPNQGWQENQIPNSTPRGALAEILHLSQHSKVWSHPPIPFSCLYPSADGKNHFPQKTQGKQELSVKNFIFDKVFSFQTGVKGQQGGNGLSKNSHSAFFKCFVGPGFKEVRERIKSTDNMLRNILESFQSLAKVFRFPLLLIIYHKMSGQALWLQPVKITSHNKILHYCFLLNCPGTASYKKVEISRKCINWNIRTCWIPHQRKRHFY